MAPDQESGGDTLVQNPAKTVDMSKKAIRHSFSYADGSTARDGQSRLRVLETDVIKLASGAEVALGTGRTGFIPVDNQKAAEELVEVIKSGALTVKFGAQQGSAFNVELVAPGQISATSKLIAIE